AADFRSHRAGDAELAAERARAAGTRRAAAVRAQLGDRAGLGAGRSPGTSRACWAPAFAGMTMRGRLRARWREDAIPLRHPSDGPPPPENLGGGISSRQGVALSFSGGWRGPLTRAEGNR